MKIECDMKFKSIKDFIQYVSLGQFDPIDKNDLIVSLCEGKNVLDLGCIDHSYQTALDLGDKWLHKQIKDVAENVTGVDILLDDINELNKRGFQIVAANVESFNLGKTYDVIVAGDLIEHLSNIGLFLDCIKKHMHEDSIFVVTTPNPFNIEQSMKAIFNGTISVNTEHTVWLNPHVCWELMTRAGLNISGFYWIETRFKVLVKNRIYCRLINLLSEYIMQRRSLCRRDFALILKK